VTGKTLSIGDFRLPIGISPKAEAILKSKIKNRKSF